MISSSNPPKTPSMPQSFSSDFQPAKPHVVIFEIIRQAIRNGDKFEIEASNTVSPNIVYKLSIGDEIDEYIARHVQRGGNDLVALDDATSTDDTNPQNQPQSDIRSDLWELFKQVPTPSKGNGTINDFFDLLVPYITNHTKAATIELEEELKAAKDNLK